MADDKSPDNASLEIARITSRWQIVTAVISVCAGIAIAVISNERFFSGPDVASGTCDLIEVAGQYGAGAGWDFEMDVSAAQFEGEEQDGDGRIEGVVTVLCSEKRFSARVEGTRMAGNSAVMCLFDGLRTGAEGRSVSGRFLCDDLSAEENATNYWRGEVRLMSEV